MFDALYIGATGMRSQQAQIDTIAQNVANLNTIGYRRSVVSFSEVVAALTASPTTADAAQGISGSSVANNSIGAGAMPALTLSLIAGELKQTGDPMNVAIDGQGFLEVTRTDGTPAFTRAGQLHVNADGLLATMDGSPLTGHVAIPSDAHDVQIATDGRVLGLAGDATVPTEFGQIELVGFANAAGLKTIGDNLYVTTSQSGDPQSGTPGTAGLGTLKQGFVESSNVQMTDELVNLMLAQRAFELNSKVIQASDQMFGITNGLYR